VLFFVSAMEFTLERARIDLMLMMGALTILLWGWIKSPIRSPRPICTRPESGRSAAWLFQRNGSADFDRSRSRSEPMAIEPRTRCPTVNGPCYPHFLYPVQAARNHATTLPAVWRATNNAGLYPSRKISRVIRRHFREQTFLWTMGRCHKRLCDFRTHQQLRIGLVQTGKLASCAQAFFGTQHLRAVLTHTCGL
jgi:hypothetical protein